MTRHGLLASSARQFWMRDSDDHSANRFPEKGPLVGITFLLMACAHSSALMLNMVEWVEVTAVAQFVDTFAAFLPTGLASYSAEGPSRQTTLCRINVPGRCAGNCYKCYLLCYRNHVIY